MSAPVKNSLLFLVLAMMFLASALMQSWGAALDMLVVGLASAIMALGVNMQWGYAGLFNVGVMGFSALGSLAMVLIATTARPQAWTAGGWMIPIALAIGAAVVLLAIGLWRWMPKGKVRALALIVLLIVGFIVYRAVFDPGVTAVEAINASAAGNIGGLGVAWFFQLLGASKDTALQLAVWVAWPVGGLIAAGAAWIVAKTALGLRSDYLAIATLGIAEIIVTVLKNEDWLDRGVKNVYGLPRPYPVPQQVDLQQHAGFISWAKSWGLDPTNAANRIVQLEYVVIFAVILIVILTLVELALKSPWGRMMRAIRDNEISAEAMGKDVKARHLQVFVIGSAVIGIAGAMVTSYTGLFSPTTYQPLRWTFLIWVMVIVGGSGNNWGSVLGGLLIYFLWIEVEPVGKWLLALITDPMPNTWALKGHLRESAEQMRLMTMGIVLLLVLRFSPRGLIPEK
ncbi:branched-chain amino acid ABC transporter permease [Acidimangrovimonas sediminis]|uniref:branched-chain amino acid ABC transporter permease n=1 Tax=Acidimangrovimonas sediminis TaxID=2056283 RepID=UPI000C807CDF|nr:branched-chain amino acid ABC transporter permease [Acidimangrovimonas sediminis]